MMLDKGQKTRRSPRACRNVIFATIPSVHSDVGEIVSLLIGAVQNQVNFATIIAE